MLWIFGELARQEYGLETAVDSLGELAPLGKGAAGEDRFEVGSPLPLMRAGGERVGAGLYPHAFAERRPELRLEGGQGDVPSVLGGVGPIGRDPAREHTAARSFALAARVDAEPERREARGGFTHRDVDHAPSPGAVSFAKRGQDADDRVERAAHIGDLDSGHLRRALPRSGQTEHSGAREVVQVVSGALRDRARRAEAADATEDEARVERPQRRAAEAEPIQDARAEALDQHVVAGDEPEERLAPGVRLQVEDGAALATIEQGEDGVEAAFSPRRHEPEVVTAAWVLELVDLRAQISEHHRGEGAGQEARQIEDPNAFERRDHCYARISWSLVASIAFPATLRSPEK